MTSIISAGRASIPTIWIFKDYFSGKRKKNCKSCGSFVPIWLDHPVIVFTFSSKQNSFPIGFYHWWRWSIRSRCCSHIWRSCCGWNITDIRTCGFQIDLLSNALLMSLTGLKRRCPVDTLFNLLMLEHYITLEFSNRVKISVWNFGSKFQLL